MGTVCNNCGKQVSDSEASFCPYCGAVIKKNEWKCEKCSTINEAEAKFCKNCGNARENEVGNTQVSANTSSSMGDFRKVQCLYRNLQHHVLRRCF